jgi:peptide/nickel transport system substrate-binding protein
MMVIRRLAALGATVLAATGLVASSALAGVPGAAAATTGAQTTNLVMTQPAKKHLSSLTWWISPYPPSSIDPVKYNDYPEDFIIPNMCDSLVRQVPGMRTVPDLAQSWQWVNPTTLVFNLRQGVEFWDGHPLTSADVVYSLKRNLDPSTQSIYAYEFQDVSSITATGPSTVQISFSKPNVTFVPEMATLAGAVVEQSYAEQQGANFGTPSGGIMCSGPFKFQSWNPANDLVIVRNDGYWNKALLPKVAKITFEWPEDAGQVASAFETGALAGGWGIPATDVAPLRATSTGKLYVGSVSRSMVVFALITVGTKGAIANPAVRQALYYSINRPAVVKAVDLGQGVPAYTDAGAGYFTYQQAKYQAAYSSFAASGYDPAKARQLVNQAGAAAKGPIVLALPSGSQQVADLGEVIQQSAAKVGLHLQLKIVPSDQYGALFSDPSARQGYDLIFTGNYDQDPDPLALYGDIALPNAISNFNNYDNPEVTSLLTQAMGATNLAKRASLVVQAQRQIMRDLPWIPISFLPNTTFVRNGVCGVPLDFSEMSSPWAASVGGC